METVLAVLFALASAGLFYSIFITVILLVDYIAHAIANQSYNFRAVTQLIMGSLSFAYIMWYIFIGGWSM
jgi:hypothetical protein